MCLRDNRTLTRMDHATTQPWTNFSKQAQAQQSLAPLSREKSLKSLIRKILLGLNGPGSKRREKNLEILAKETSTRPRLIVFVFPSYIFHIVLPALYIDAISHLDWLHYCDSSRSSGTLAASTWGGMISVNSAGLFISVLFDSRFEAGLILRST